MSLSYPIATPAGYAPAFALGFADNTGELSLVAQSAPLPVQIMNDSGNAPASEPVAGDANGPETVGPFNPRPGAPVMLTLSGDWEGSVQLLRSVLDHAPPQPTTLAGEPWAHFTGNACEPVWIESETGARLHLAITVTSGTLSYRIAQ
ncbi:hypothetical protein MB02_08640 [Croceicoccus estronivorus]|uniref:hypothetical protein n=1 Tax=Croceicoccus estronivorus TaxID=1172626 RepID=UPI00083641FE|nr:hypothetical protein [Croceicoccus estronivorus]OCC23880.1 hypothetical protein MB02_08640 [Croceicoccus estronivorus]